MHRHSSFGNPDLVALMAAHRTSTRSGAKPESLQHEIAGIATEIETTLDNKPTSAAAVARNADLGERVADQLDSRPYSHSGLASTVALNLDGQF